MHWGTQLGYSTRTGVLKNLTGASCSGCSLTYPTHSSPGSPGPGHPGQCSWSGLGARIYRGTVSTSAHTKKSRFFKGPPPGTPVPPVAAIEVELGQARGERSPELGAERGSVRGAPRTVPSAGAGARTWFLVHMGIHPNRSDSKTMQNLQNHHPKAQAKEQVLGVGPQRHTSYYPL